jgi:hypothetical protein
MIIGIASRGNQIVVLAFEDRQESSIESVRRPGSPARPVRRTKSQWANPTEVATYEGEPDQVFELISIFIRKWVARSLTRLHEQMLNEQG